MQDFPAPSTGDRFFDLTNKPQALLFLGGIAVGYGYTLALLASTTGNPLLVQATLGLGLALQFYGDA